MAFTAPDQINKVVLFWYPLKRNFSSVGLCTLLRHFLQGTRQHTCLSGRVVSAMKVYEVKTDAFHEPYNLQLMRLQLTTYESMHSQILDF